MRISQDLATDISIKLSEKKNQEKLKVYKEFEDEIVAIYLASLPKDVVSVWKKHPRYVDKTRSLRLNSHGFNHTYINLKNHVPSEDGRSCYVDITKEQRASLLKKWQNHEKLEAEYKDLMLQIKKALLSLVTYKRIVDQFPEAGEFLPTQPNVVALTVDLNKIRERIK